MFKTGDLVVFTKKGNTQYYIRGYNVSPAKIGDVFKVTGVEGRIGRHFYAIEESYTGKTDCNWCGVIFDKNFELSKMDERE